MSISFIYARFRLIIGSFFRRLRRKIIRAQYVFVGKLKILYRKAKRVCNRKKHLALIPRWFFCFAGMLNSVSENGFSATKRTTKSLTHGQLAAPFLCFLKKAFSGNDGLTRLFYSRDSEKGFIGEQL